jgi:hypothetical protein
VTKVSFVINISPASGMGWNPGFGEQVSDLAGTSRGWMVKDLMVGDDYGGAGPYQVQATTVAGPTSGIDFEQSGHPARSMWMSKPLKTAVTISGSITFNIWAHESNAAANATLRVVLKRVNAKSEIVSTIIDSTYGTELGTATAAKNWSATPTSTSMEVGDRIVGFVGTTDATGLTMASGHTVTMNYNATTSGGTGDSYFTTTESLGFFDPASHPFTGPTTWYLRSTAADADITYGSTTKKAALSAAGSSIVTHGLSSRAGWQSPFQVEDGAGTPIEWFTERLAGTTLSGGAVHCFAYVKESSLSANAGFRIQTATVDNDGSNATVFADIITFGVDGEIFTSVGAFGYENWLIHGPLTIADGQRIRFRLYWDDTNPLAQASGYTLTHEYNAAVNTEGNARFRMFGNLSAYVPPTIYPQL